LWTQGRCEEVVDFCCEGQDCDIALFAYDPMPQLIADSPDLSPDQKRGLARETARAECFRHHIRCPGLCDVRSVVREGLPPENCAADEVFVNGYIWQFVPFPLNIAGAHRDCRLVRGCCRGFDCLAAAPLDPQQVEPANTKGDCLSAFPTACLGLEDTTFVRALFFENAGASGGRLVGLDTEGNLICMNPEYNPANLDAFPVSTTLTRIPERHLAQVVMLGNFDLNADGLVDSTDVCEMETAIASGAEPCRPAGSGDPVAGACAPYPGGECSVTADLNRDARVDETDLALIEREVGLRCDGSPVP
jgi:hypothetical protein